MNKFTSSPWGFRFYDFGRYCKFMKNIGISDICTLFGNPAEFPLAFKPGKKEITDKKAEAEDNGVNIAEISTTLDYKTEIPLAGFLGAKYVRVCEIWEDTEEKYKEVVNLLKDAGQIAREYGICITVENHGGLMAAAKKCRKLLEEVNMENVKLNYDPANFLYYGEDPQAAMDEITDFIGFTHFKNVRYTDGKPEYCRVEEGVIDYKKNFNRLFPGYKGYIGLEYEKPEDVEDGTTDDFRYIKNLL
jgi:sugar phosphate isomerase/epimerase